METVFNISVFTENSIGILNRITIIFTRRHLNIESITASESEVKGVYRYTIVVKTNLDQVKKVVAQIEKQVEVLKAFFHTDEQVVHQEIALYKITTESFVNGGTEHIVRNHHARILTVDKEFTIIEKTGQPEELQDLFNELDQYGVLEFVRSGRVAISKPMKTLETYLKELEAE
ncbi:MAG: acetolactate synthase small subunit [Crocinitomicaceae bacterium]|nr:acetolactate synthase small subunit [Crocinitomicaceae bacterium]MCF8434819.1 acetolactate synthase small subunit [Crocinitomicaceae bacterium]